MKQHRSFKKDMDLISEMYGQIGGMTIQTTGTAGEAAEHMRDEDGEDHNKTGDLSDADLLKHARTADGNLKPEARDALAKLYGHEDNEDHHEDESYEQKMNQMGAAHGYTGAGKGHATD
mgnify:CR=1 FL=1|tara:strand:+ start:133 stop:489 length:357 start_codon:yes stop_codon:yes gene_type:complete